MKYSASAAPWICIILATTSWSREPEVPQPLPPQEAADSMRVPTGFQVSLFAGEPDVMQPIGFCIDDSGRLWVAEAYNYPVHGTGSGDRIVILEDSDGDGRHDRRQVFYEDLNYVTGIETGFGGAWVMSPPNLFFIPDRDGNDVPDGPAEVVLDGFGNHANAHNLANGFAWGPDGWLYGTHGRTNWSMIGPPGTPEDERIRFDGGVYRIDPVRRTWEPYADGTTNPWGIDWNDYGHAFVCNCVNPHLFQVIQGAHYEPWRGRDSSRYAYQRIDTIADHLHFVGLSNVRGGLGSAEEDAAGGGHAHCGTMIYLGNNFPDSYRNTLFTNNIHGRRINNDILRSHGSGYVASHGPDLMRSQDPWFMGVTLAYGPAGEVYVSDWSDTGECHSVRNTRRGTGRIYRLTYGSPQRERVDLAECSDDELIDYQLHPNDWYVRHARRLLHERSAAGGDMSSVHRRLHEQFVHQTDVTRQLRALWALRVTDGLDEPFLIAALQHASPHIRSWAVTLLCEPGTPAAPVLQRMVAMAKTEPSPLVRLSLASGLQRMDWSARWDLVSGLAARNEDRDDPNLPLMIWYGCEPLVQQDARRFAELAATASLPTVRIHAARRLADQSEIEPGLEWLVQQLCQPLSDEITEDLLHGLLQGIEGRRSLPLPTSWHQAYQRLSNCSSSQIRDSAMRLAVVFDDPQALESLQRLASDPNESSQERRRAIGALVAKKASSFDQTLIELLDQPAVRLAAIEGLAVYDHPQTVQTLLTRYPEMTSGEQSAALATMAARASWADALLEAVESGRIDSRDLTAYTARQLVALGNADIDARLASVWGELRETSRDRAKQIASIRNWLTPQLLQQADLERGRQLFDKQCATCHRFFGAGGQLGPDITGAPRNNIDYLLENVVDPNGLVAADYRMSIVQTEDGRIVTGLVESEDQQTLVIQTANERLVFPQSEVVAQKKSDVSIMPEGLLEPLSEEEIRDLFGYIQRRQ